MNKQVAERILGYVILILISFILFYLASRHVGDAPLVAQSTDVMFEEKGPASVPITPEKLVDRNMDAMHEDTGPALVPIASKNIDSPSIAPQKTVTVKAPVDVSADKSPVSKVVHYHAVQLGAFTTENAANTFLAQMKMIGVDDSYVVKRSNPVRFVVVVGSFQDIAAARDCKKKLLGMDIEGFVVKL